MDLLVSFQPITSVDRVAKLIFLFHRISMLKVGRGHESEIDFTSSGTIQFLHLINWKNLINRTIAATQSLSEIHARLSHEWRVDMGDTREARRILRILKMDRAPSGPILLLFLRCHFCQLWRNDARCGRCLVLVFGRSFVVIFTTIGILLLLLVKNAVVTIIIYSAGHDGRVSNVLSVTQRLRLSKSLYLTSSGNLKSLFKSLDTIFDEILTHLLNVFLVEWPHYGLLTIHNASLGRLVNAVTLLVI